MSIEQHLRDRRDAGRNLLVPYVTGGWPSDWADVVRAVADAGADAVEIGIPFSDPVMDGPVIQESTRRALEAGTTPTSVLHALTTIDAGVPLIVMTSYNICFRAGHERFARTPPPLKLFVTSTPAPFARALDDHGKDVSDVIRTRDGKYLGGFPLGEYQGVATDHWVELAFSGQLGQILRVALQRLILCFGVLVGHLLRSPYLRKRLKDLLVRRPRALEKPLRRIVPNLGQSQQ